ncbi:hypothetical protein IE53DRAFT_288134 [Violaceomyces palustris]|uniref:Uncharacterized protein n=1 Tax=Violaceomyces palustris TaxID=1673888 RepID=A0ACD0P2W0_9BASI|nr:hypothetical protein IE53DRAFT_288134 [Violaceomyces palustris]
MQKGRSLSKSLPVNQPSCCCCIDQQHKGVAKAQEGKAFSWTSQRLYMPQVPKQVILQPSLVKTPYREMCRKSGDSQGGLAQEVWAHQELAIGIEKSLLFLFVEDTGQRVKSRNERIDLVRTRPKTQKRDGIGLIQNQGHQSLAGGYSTHAWTASAGPYPDRFSRDSSFEQHRMAHASHSRLPFPPQARVRAWRAGLGSAGES